MAPANAAFVIRGDDGEEYGPAGLDELREWVRENRAGIGTEVRFDEPDAPWLPWQAYPQLVALLAEVQVTNVTTGPVALVIAPMGRRVTAFALDLLLITALYIPVWTVTAIVIVPDWVIHYIVSFFQYAASGSTTLFVPPELPFAGWAAGNLIYNLLFALYFTGFHAAHGTTPAKSLLRIRVVDETGQKPSLGKSIFRAVAMDFSMNFLLCLPMAYAFLNPERRSIHDIVAGTYVVEA